MALAFGVAEQANDLRVLGVAEDDGSIALARMHAHLAGDDADVGAGGVAEFHAERLQVFAALGRDAVRAHNHDGSGIGGLRDLELGLTTVIPDLADTLAGEDFHHLAVMDQRPIRVDGVTSLLRVFAGDIDGAFDAPTETRGLGSDDLHGFKVRASPPDSSKVPPYLAGTPQTSVSI